MHCYESNDKHEATRTVTAHRVQTDRAIAALVRVSIAYNKFNQGQALKTAELHAVIE